MSETVRTYDRRTFLTAALAGTGALALGPLVASCSDADPAVPTPGNPSDHPAPANEAPENPAAKGEFAAEPSWRQNFVEMADGPVDTSVWHFEDNSEVPGYNEEAQGFSNSEEFVRVEDGNLVIQAKKKPFTYPDGTTYDYTSGRIDTQNSFSFTYGKIEATMQLPEGAGTWPAFWLLSANQPNTSKLHPTDEDWQTPGFYAKDGELDIMEWYGHTPGMVEGTVHTYQTAKDEDNDGRRDADARNIQNTGQIAAPKDASTAFHTYGAEVTPGCITWTLDGKPYFTFKNSAGGTDAWPFTDENKLYPILNLAMGGTGGGEIDDSQADKWMLKVKDVAYYPYTGAR